MSSYKPSLLVAGLMCAAVSPAVAGDSSSSQLPFNVLFGTKIANEYNLRSVSQTQGRPAAQGYIELNFANGLYAGFWASNVDFDATDPYAEFDYYGGIRHSFDALSLDVGYVYIDYIGENPGNQLDFWKIYGIAKYALTDDLTIGANLYWSNSFIGFNGVDGTHSSFFARRALPELNLPYDISSYVSGEIGHQWVGSNFAPGYTFWNAGMGFTHKAMTLDLRYTGSDLSKSECVAFIGQADSCGNRFLLSLSFDTSLNQIK
ncbi:TorF family putative porin [Hyphomicrobium sp. D-2]|uniref:TorF family putative porin n=1 Tax=Hyphomicrobium sp. D-2 TaxID=3041621 RepID=UPI0024539918|nr:TorF family putative porin [Hyphomicrobium sp. D-2]MDH4980717.1 TorF family putative porin [Hyphomicrobium sp. D-2]